MKSVLFPPFLTKIVLTDGETAAEALLKIFSKRINKKEAENATEESDTDEDIRSDKDNNKERVKTISTKDATMCDATEVILAGCNNILAFIQAVALKAPQVLMSPISLRADKHTTSWFR